MISINCTLIYNRFFLTPKCMIMDKTKAILNLVLTILYNLHLHNLMKKYQITNQFDNEINL